MKKKKNKAPPPQITPKAEIYLNLWIELNRSREEEEIDNIRKDMRIHWDQMDKEDIKSFKLFADEIEARERNRKTNRPQS